MTTARGPVAADTRLYGSKRSAVISRRVAIFFRLTSDGVCDGAELGRSGEHPVIQHPLHVCHVHGHEELEDPWNPARPGLRPRFLDPAYASQKFRMSFRVDRNTRCSNSSVARLGTAPCSAGTSSDWEPSAFETRAESIGMCRKRSFATDGHERRPASTCACRIPCLILCLAYVVERVGQCRAPKAPCGVYGRPVAHTRRGIGSKGSRDSPAAFRDTGRPSPMLSDALPAGIIFGLGMALGAANFITP